MMASNNRIESILDLNFSDFLWIVSYIVLMFSITIQNIIGFSYLDELATCVLVIAVAWKLFGAWYKNELVVPTPAVISIAAFLLFILVGVICNYLFKYQTQLINILIDIFTCIKFPITLLCTILLFRNRDINFYLMIEKFCRMLVTLLLVLAILNLLIDFGMGTDPRFGLRSSFMFICGHPAYLALLCMGVFLIFIRDVDKNKLFIFFTILVMASTLRSKALAFCAVGPSVIYFMRPGRKITFIHVLLFIVVALAIGWDQFSYYYQTDGSARAEITRASLEIAHDYFPLGTGFASFGSVYSAEGNYYSPLYYDYELDEIWGLTPGDTFFLSDTFWPTLLGQFGVIGLSLFLIGLASAVIWASSSGPESRMAIVCCIAYYVIESTSASALFNPTSVYISMSLGFVVSSFLTKKNIADTIPSALASDHRIGANQ